VVRGWALASCGAVVMPKRACQRGHATVSGSICSPLACAADVIALIAKVRRAIRRQTGVRLDLELKIVGEV